MEPHVLIPSLYVLMVRDLRKVLLLRRREDGLYTLPNGPLLDGEKMLEAAARIVKMSVGDERSRVGPLILLHIMRRYKPGEDKLHFFYETQSWNLMVTIADPRYDEVIWADMDNLPTNCEMHVYDFIRYLYVHPRNFSELGWGKERIPKKITPVTWF